MEIGFVKFFWKVHIIKKSAAYFIKQTGQNANSWIMYREIMYLLYLSVTYDLTSKICGVNELWYIGFYIDSARLKGTCHTVLDAQVLGWNFHHGKFFKQILDQKLYF